jgi:murein DD-endopeptidase MepM/ murein hydrolase activator NlpD
VLTQTSTPVPIRLARRIILGTTLAGITYAAAASIYVGIEFGLQQGVDAALWRVASVAAPPKAVAVEATPKKLAAKKPVAPAPSTTLIRPAKGIDWGIIHGNNGVDIANKCGTSIVAAASGTVTEVGTGWNGGYGNAIRIQHKKTSTYYAHLSELHVSVGDVVEQGEVIGLMGITGKSTGCHVHFEVRGGTNPFGK